MTDNVNQGGTFDGVPDAGEFVDETQTTQRTPERPAAGTGQQRRTETPREDEGGDDARGEGGDDEPEANKRQPDPHKTIARQNRRIGRQTAQLTAAQQRIAELESQIHGDRRTRSATDDTSGNGGDADEEGTNGQEANESRTPQRRQTASQDVETRAREIAQEVIRGSQVKQTALSMIEKGAAEFDGFKDRIPVLAEIVPILDRNHRPTPFGDALLECDAPHVVANHLADNPELAEDFAEWAETNPRRMVRELAKLEAQLVSAPPAKKTTKAPPPVSTQRSTARGEPDAEQDTEGWIESRNRASRGR